MADEEEVWKSAVLKEDYTDGNELQILYEDGEVNIFFYKFISFPSEFNLILSF